MYEARADEILNEIKSNEHVRRMKKYIQHGSVSTYAHCESVAKVSCEIDRRLRLHADIEALLMGAMLHDFYLYDWHKPGDGTHRWHGFRHAERACRNAEQYLQVNGQVGHIIRCHMWPLNLTKIPATREAWIVCFADKFVSLCETVFRR